MTPTIKELSDVLIKYMGHKPHKTHSYDGINIKLGKIEGVTPSMIGCVILDLECSEDIIEDSLLGEMVGQMLTAKGRRLAKKLRGMK